MFRLYGLLKGRLDLQTKGSGGPGYFGKAFLSEGGPNSDPVKKLRILFHVALLCCGLGNVAMIPAEKGRYQFHYLGVIQSTQAMQINTGMGSMRVWETPSAE
jgi:hypothetical protein